MQPQSYANYTRLRRNWSAKRSYSQTVKPEPSRGCTWTTRTVCAFLSRDIRASGPSPQLSWRRIDAAQPPDFSTVGDRESSTTTATSLSSRASFLRFARLASSVFTHFTGWPLCALFSGRRPGRGQGWSHHPSAGSAGVVSWYARSSPASRRPRQKAWKTVQIAMPQNLAGNTAGPSSLVRCKSALRDLRPSPCSWRSCSLRDGVANADAGASNSRLGHSRASPRRRDCAPRPRGPELDGARSEQTTRHAGRGPTRTTMIRRFAPKDGA